MIQPYVDGCGGCVDDVVNNQATMNNQLSIISLLQSYLNISKIVQECVGLSEELLLMGTSVLNHS